MPGYGQMLATAERWREMPAIEQVSSGVALTFDDGPDAAGPPPILDALDAAGAKATFFLVGEQLMRNHALARDAAARGHELALHGFEHVDHDTLRPQAARDDIARALGSFEAATGRRAPFFRPPYGRFSQASYDACLHLGLEPVYWSQWGEDWEPIPAERIVDLAARDLANGDIVLLHDPPRYAPRPNCAPTAEAIGPIVARARDLGLRVGPLGALVD